jgi:hypothetical protein
LQGALQQQRGHTPPYPPPGHTPPHAGAYRTYPPTWGIAHIHGHTHPPPPTWGIPTHTPTYRGTWGTGTHTLPALGIGGVSTHTWAYRAYIPHPPIPPRTGMHPRIHPQEGAYREGSGVTRP